MNSRERFLTALALEKPDRLPVTTHHVMPWFLENVMDSMNDQEFFDYFDLDPVRWVWGGKPDNNEQAYFHRAENAAKGEDRLYLCTDEWRYTRTELPGSQYKTFRYDCITPGKTLSMVIQSNEHTEWVAEPLFKEKADFEYYARYCPAILADIQQLNSMVDDFGHRGLTRGTIPGFEIFGQPGCWQDIAVLFGVENLILETFYDPEWVHDVLEIFLERKLRYVHSLEGSRVDLFELGGGSASSTIISPDIFEKFVVPYDKKLIEAAHALNQKVVYHTCGGMMPILEKIADMEPDAMETFTPATLGGDVDLGEAKKRIGDKCCMIGGFDQLKYFKGCSQDETRKAVRRYFEEAGEGGGYILSPSDHFFEADRQLIHAFADEAKKCVY